MNFLALNDDVKFIIANHLASDLKIRTLLSKNHDIQKKIFNDVAYNDDLNNYINLMYNAKEKNILKMPKYSKYIKISHIQEMSYILVALVIL